MEKFNKTNKRTCRYKYIHMFLTLFLISCTNLSKQAEVVNSITQSDSTNIIVKKTLFENFLSLILSSNLDIFEDWSKDNIYIETDEYKECNDYKYRFNIISRHSPKDEEVNDVTIAQVYYDAIRKELYDISADKDIPCKLSYDKNIETSLLREIVKRCGSIPAYIKPKMIKLPFSLNEWNTWYNVNENNLNTSEPPFYFYFVEDDLILNSILLKSDLHQDAIPYLYFILEDNLSKKTLLLLSKYENKKYPAMGIQDKYYDIITLTNNSIKHSLMIGYIPDPLEDGKTFNIDNSLKIKTYDQLMCSDDARLACDTFKTTTYQITENGNIKKIEEILNENYEEIDGVIRRK